MYTKWYTHIKDPEQQDKFRDQILSAKPVLERIAQILQEEKQGIDTSITSIKAFDTPNWDVKRAFKDGCLCELNFVNKLIDLEQQN